MNREVVSYLEKVEAGHRPTREEALLLADEIDIPRLMATAAFLRDQGHRNIITFSKKVFIPLTHLCRDVCHYCTFAQPPKKGEQVFMTPEQVLDIARQGAAMGCKEALFTLGDKPELRYKAAREALAALGHETTLSYLAAMAKLVHEETGLFPHLNPGLMSDEDLAILRPLAPSMGIMLESTAISLLEKGKAHHGSPDKDPAVRLEGLRRAGRAQVPFTSGILIGIGETRAERIESLLALRDIHDEFGNLQEVIIQNFRAKPGTRMSDAPEPDLDELLWTLAITRIVFGPEMNIQVPPNLSPGQLQPLVAAGINDWGGVSPLTPDFVNPEAPWPHLDKLATETAATGKLLIERLTIYPEYALQPERWLDPAMRTSVIQAIDSEGYPRTEEWSPGEDTPPPEADLKLLAAHMPARVDPWLKSILDRAVKGERLDETEVSRLFLARGDEFTAVCRTADQLRQKMNGDTVTYVVNRNINYTNVCYFKCQFCAFSKGKLTENLRGKPYVLGMDEIQRRTQEAWSRGATEVCMQGGIHPSYTGQTYIDITRAVKEAVPGMHVHAFSPLEVWQGAETLGISLKEFLSRLKDAGLGTLPGTAGEVLDDEVRRVLCPDKINTAQWFEVMETAHSLGIRTTSTIMYGHIDGPINWARHLLGLRDLQARTGGFTEFVPLPFVHMEAPIYLKGRARKGPTFREAVLMHAVARLTLHPHITNIQTSWVKMGPEGVKACLNAGVNDMGGTLMNETITRAAGASHGQEMEPYRMEDIIRGNARLPRQRSTPYGDVPDERVRVSFQAAPLEDLRFTAAKEYERS
ncbi:5-amino-6-(D-ribitylamino)uracil--L-tyrosine 4-hydroxyphenyl transferase CofH [Emcibacter sp. SYSU 3D8]|uniref:5-amino-6-(D-ribitylamino)uracil--L-tyrosine 4-hydroxyphenyl transferase CofH n=1 Tax=Emcibacter sp. SYSU 3D8 TaxID=3133969 RepID=UPI0031FE6176